MMRKGEERTHFQRKKKNQKSNSPKNKKNPFSPNQKKLNLFPFNMNLFHYLNQTQSLPFFSLQSGVTLNYQIETFFFFLKT